MEIIPIFEENLYATKYSGESKDELERLFDLWDDIEHLNEFFEEHEADLGYFKLSIEQAVQETRKEAEKLSDALFNALSESPVQLETLFRNLDNKEIQTISLSKQKSKRRWLRLYAIRIDKDVYLITGGAIKLTHKMDEREHTDNELSKLEICKSYLQENNVFDDDSFKEMLNE
ncbi:hypothetical protein BZG02_11290 [Labilibaculum filiforme]|uniref:Uncharacterized protein n=1 Tax=Labilibaculum filiforme TaxID=1940526 RepID=A0A2N3HXL8_9BACT|nr:hypothetical protein [Labilibaculum filiforme]PKQ62777.1 hypothetical protein BZG02_11290 [Labilibaculum filiforme]